MKPICRRHLLPVLLAGFSITSIHATPFAAGAKIGIDFGPTAPTNNMNQVHNASPVNDSIAAGGLVSTTSVTMDGVGFSWASTGGWFSSDDADGGLSGQSAAFNESNLTDFYGVSTIEGDPAGVITLTFTGLDNAFTYNLVVGAAYAGDIANVTWAADSQSATTNAQVGSSAYVTLTGLHTDGSGNLVITGTGTAPRADIAVVSALQLTAVGTVIQPAILSFAGVINDDAGSEISQWKTVSTTKTLDGDGDNAYGTLAHLVYAYEFKGQGTLYTFDGADSQVGPFGSYALIDAPTGLGDINVATTSNGGGGGADHVMFTFAALAGSPANVRIGIATDGLDDAGYSSATIGLRQVGGSAVEYTMTSTNSTLDMVFFDVTGITAGNQFEVFADAGAYGYATHHFITWDAIPAPGAGYGGWASGFLPAFTNTAANLDFENDGLDSAIEWVVGGDPTLNDAASVAPTFNNTTDPDDFLFTFRRRDTAATDPNTTIVVEYGSNLTGWTAAQNAVNGVSIDDTTNLGGGFHQVTVAIPRVLAGGSGKLFARLKIIVGP